MSRRMPVLLCLCLLLLASCGSGNSLQVQITPDVDQPGSDLPSPTTQSLSELLQTEQMVLKTPTLASDLASLAQRFKDVSVAQPTRTSPLNEQVGNEDTFWVYNQDTQTYSRLHARLVYITAHAYMYVEDGQPFNQTTLQLSANTFEEQIYPTLSTNAGSEWTPGVDEDVHLTILNTVGLGTNIGGYFSALDEYPAPVNPYSNQREMFYVNLNGEIPGSADYNSVLANEFQRLITWHEHPQAPNWLNEGMALLAQHMNNYPTTGVERAFLQNPDTQLNGWSNSPKLEPAYAGASYLFFAYFVEHYGGYSLVKELLQDAANPPTNFDDVLASHSDAEHFADVLGKWFVANFVANPSIDNGEYGYTSLHLSGVTPQHTITTLPAIANDQVHQNAAEYYDLHPQPGKGKVLNIQFTGAPTVRLIGNNPLDSTNEWWGNRGNNIDSTLTHDFDLSSLKGRSVSLQFATWFDLEQNHDYAFIEVSTDGGKHWTTLRGNNTTESNLDGLNWGQGYTGVSGGGTTPIWEQESVDLTPYAGKKIQVRFEQVTDSTLILQGFALDQIRIPELNFQDNLNSDNGWISNGFIRSDNILPEQYLVQAIVYTGSTFTVQNINIDLASAKGKLTIPAFGNQVTRVVLVVAAYAPQTTLQAHYQLDLRTA